jgi:hypothetical protein
MVSDAEVLKLQPAALLLRADAEAMAQASNRVR